MKLLNWSILFLTLLLMRCSPHLGPKVDSSAPINATWEVYENTLSATNNKTIWNQLQGTWAVDKALYKMGENVSIMTIENSTFEVKDSTYRNDQDLRFKPMLLKQNIIYNPITGDSTVIEKLTENELILTRKESIANSMRFYFRKTK